MGRTQGRMAGMSGLLEVDLGRRADGTTAILSQSSEAPLLSQRAVYADSGFPGLAHVCIMSSSGGMLQGDSHRTRIRLGAGAQARITTQGATRIYGMERGGAEHAIGIGLEDGAYLEYLPGQIIPYAGSEYVQKTEIRAHSGATLFCSEVITPGRVAMGESFGYDSCRIMTRACDENGRVRLVDNSYLAPRAQNLAETGVLAGRAVAGSAYLLSGSERARRVLDAINGREPDEGILLGASLLYAGDGLTARILGERADAVAGLVSEIARIVRQDAAPELAAEPACNMR